MEYVKMSEDVQFSRIILGFWRFLDWDMTTQKLVSFLDECIDLGITTIDHADIYGNYTIEEKFGDALRLKPELKKKIEIITKCGIVYPSSTSRIKYYDHTTRYIIQQAEKSLKFMDVDTIDCLLLHRPSPFYNPQEVADAFEKLYKDGKVKSFGVSNFLPYQFETLKSYCSVPFVTNQVEMSCLSHESFENGVLDMCLREKIHPIAWSPLAGGRIFSGDSEIEKRVRKALEEVRADYGADSIGEIAFAWVLSHPAKVMPITGSGEIDYIKSPIKALKYKLTEEQWFMIWTAYKGYKVL